MIDYRRMVYMCGAVAGRCSKQSHWNKIPIECSLSIFLIPDGWTKPPSVPSDDAIMYCFTIHLHNRNIYFKPSENPLLPPKIWSANGWRYGECKAERVFFTVAIALSLNAWVCQRHTHIACVAHWLLCSPRSLAIWYQIGFPVIVIPRILPLGIGTAEGKSIG